MKKIWLIAIVLLVLCMFVGCLPIVPNTPDDGGSSSDEPSSELMFSDEKSAQNSNFYKKYSAQEKDLYYKLWQDTTQIRLKIDIEQSELAKINEAYLDFRNTGNSAKADTYRKCNLTVTVDGQDYYFEEVGIRMRGNTSRREFCDDNGNMYAYVHFRFNLSETFDGDDYAAGAWASDIAKQWTDSSARAARKNRTFATMEKFYYKWNKNYDNTYIREVYANKMFQSVGILAPHITLAQIEIKQQGAFQNLGVGTFYETVDKQFIKRNFSAEETGGDLYKCGWPANLTTADGRGVETPTQRFVYSLKTNNDRTAPDYNHHKYLIALVDVLKKSQNASDFTTELEKLVDMNYFAAFEAVNYLLGNPDCIRNNANNYYMYFVPTDGKMFLIPYDYDRCLGINVDWNPSGNSMTQIKPFATSGANGATENPLYTKTILSSGLKQYQELYQNNLQQVLKGKWFTYENFLQMFNNYKYNYSNVAQPSDVIKTMCGGCVQMDRFVFSDRGTTDLSSNRDNISTEQYMQLKRQCVESNLLVF